MTDHYQEMVRRLAPLETADVVTILVTLVNNGTLTAELARNLLADAVIRHFCPAPNGREAADVGN